MADFITLDKGNLAIQTEVWTLSLDEAKGAQGFLDCKSKGSYWYRELVQPTRRARRNKAETVKVYTAGFSTSALSNALYNWECGEDPIY